MRRLPPLNSLRVFEVAARTASYADAGTELGLTHGAVSRQIAILETWLGHRLFVRVGRRMIATPAAQAFAAEVSLSFDRVNAAAEACGRPDAHRVLRLSAPTTFAMRWLIPRLHRFHARHRGVEVTVATTTTLRDELRGGFDIAIRRDRPASAGAAWGPYRATPFLGETDTLVASPALLSNTPLRTRGDIASHTLLATETRPSDWTDWALAAGLPFPLGQRRVFDHYFVTLQAITDGLGIGIGPFPVLDGEVAAGRLVAPFPEITVARAGYVALVPLDADKGASLDSLVQWLQDEAGSRSG